MKTFGTKSFVETCGVVVKLLYQEHIVYTARYIRRKFAVERLSYLHIWPKVFGMKATHAHAPPDICPVTAENNGAPSRSHEESETETGYVKRYAQAFGVFGTVPVLFLVFVDAA